MPIPPAREPPDLPGLFGVLAEHEVAFVVTGSTAALLHGVDVVPGDLDITPALDTPNLTRLAAALATIGARPDPEGPFGDWQPRPDGGWRWVQRAPRPGEREARLAWSPDPTDPASFDALLQTRLGALDVVPAVAGRYEELIHRATQVEAFGHVVWAASVVDQLAPLTLATREKDRARIDALRAIRRRIETD